MQCMKIILVTESFLGIDLGGELQDPLGYQNPRMLNPLQCSLFFPPKYFQSVVG